MLIENFDFEAKIIHTPGDDLDILVAMNPAGLKVHLGDLKDNGMLIINTDNFTPKNLKLAKYEENPLDDSALDKKYRIIKVGMTSLVTEALKDLDLIQDLIKEHGIRSELTQACHDRFQEAASRYGNEAGEMTVCKLIEEDANIDLRVKGNWTAPWNVKHSSEE